MTPDVTSSPTPSSADPTPPRPARVAAPGPSDDHMHRRGSIASLRRHTARGVLVNGAFNLSLTGLNVARGLIVAAFLTRTQYGIWGVLSLSMWTALALKNQFGAGDKYVQQAEEDQELAFQRAFTIELIFAAAMVPVAAAVVVLYAVISGHWVVLVPGLLMLALMPSIALQFPVTVFYRRMDYRRQRLLQATDPVVATAVTIVLAILGAGYWSFVVGTLAGSWTGAAMALWATPYRLTVRYHRGSLHDYLGFSAPLAIAGLAGIVMFQVIYIVGGVAIGLAGLGAFTLVGNFVQFTNQADAIVTNTLYPAICAVRDRVELLGEIFVKSNRLSLMWAVPFGVGLTLFCSDLFRFVIGHGWLPAVGLMQVMGLVTAIHHVGYNWTAFFRARGRTWPIAIVAVVSVVVLIAVGVPLMFSLGLIGLGYGFAASEFASFIMRAVLLARFFDGFRLQRHLVRAFQPTAIAVVAVVLCRALAGPEQSLPAAVAMFALYAFITVAATATLERPLIREASGYAWTRSRFSFDSSAIPGS